MTKSIVIKIIRFIKKNIISKFIELLIHCKFNTLYNNLDDAMDAHCNNGNNNVCKYC